MSSLHDPMNTTDEDGAACQVCGEDAVTTVLPLGDTMPSAICGDCRDDQTTTCPGCERLIWQEQGHRLSGPELYCRDCYYQHPVIVREGAQVLRDSERVGK